MSSPTVRLEAFSDGVFAIAITLLIIEIKVPAMEVVRSQHSLGHALLEEWPSWFAFVLSFGTILIAWANHHGAIKLVHQSSGLFHFTNGFFLMTIVLLPYPTRLLAEYVNTTYAQTAVMVYAGAIVLQNLSWMFLFQSMLRPLDLSANATSRNVILKTRTQCLQAFFVYLMIFTLAYWFPIVALCFMAVLWVVWIVMAIHLNQKELNLT